MLTWSLAVSFPAGSDIASVLGREPLYPTLALALPQRLEDLEPDQPIGFEVGQDLDHAVGAALADLVYRCRPRTRT